MAFSFNWRALLANIPALLARIRGDVAANVPLPAPPPLTLTSAVNDMKAFQAALEQLAPKIAILQAHPGLIAAEQDVAAELGRDGLPVAVEIGDALAAVASAIGEVQADLPYLISVASEFEPAATGVVGDAPADGGARIGRG